MQQWFSGICSHEKRLADGIAAHDCDRADGVRLEQDHRGDPSIPGEFTIRSAAYRYQMSPEAVEAKLKAWGFDAPEALQ